MIAQGSPGQLEADSESIMGPFLAGARAVSAGRPARPGPAGQIVIEVGDLYNLHDVIAAFPVNRRLLRWPGRPEPGRRPSSWTA